MAQASFRLALDRTYISTTVQPRAAEMTAKRGAERTRDRARANLKAAGRMRSGKLHNSIQARKESERGGRVVYTVGSPLEYASYQEYGIGPVHARKGKVLAFKPKGSSVTIFRPRTKGFSGAFFLKKARDAITVNDFLP